jgi:hypothetical protein
MWEEEKGKSKCASEEEESKKESKEFPNFAFREIDLFCLFNGEVVSPFLGGIEPGFWILHEFTTTTQKKKLGNCRKEEEKKGKKTTGVMPKKGESFEWWIKVK